MSMLWLYSQRAGPGKQRLPLHMVSLNATHARPVRHIVSFDATHVVDDVASISSGVPAGDSRWTRGARRGSAPGRNCRPVTAWRAPPGRGLHSSTFQLNLIHFGHTSPCPLF
jgi:hypothetical protein